MPWVRVKNIDADKLVECVRKYATYRDAATAAMKPMLDPSGSAWVSSSEERQVFGEMVNQYDLLCWDRYQDIYSVIGHMMNREPTMVEQWVNE
jgi:hypothetical protein